ncbi:PREDICTED: uncharacterized protein LOC101306870 [Fragaria vesca subsp. vesca]|uniref:uncharacterized protein LOC101306870 n=1 Tax=Fragaria vesca subsp. vesca TaxID=101020 RepID=UPI0002C3695C|nr:PREDICTED: uncharacterized protein LOC101306870 [Fragaria vesca subsp. vesca]
MNSAHLLHLSPQFHALNPNHSSSSSSINLLRLCKFNSVSLASLPKPSRLITLCASSSDKLSSESAPPESIREGFLHFQNDPSQWNVEVGSPKVPGPSVAKLSLGDQAFFLMAFIACTTSVAFTSLVIAAVPAICAMGRAATSLSKLADTARQELPSTMAAIRLSGMEISDLTLELNDLSQEIADGVSKSTQAVQAAEAGIRQIGSLARQQTMSMIQERANLPVISLQPAVIGAAKKTSQAVGQVTKKFMNIISQRDSENEDDIGIESIDRVEI